jgi:ferritin-like metal-binding protein YciE
MLHCTIRWCHPCRDQVPNAVWATNNAPHHVGVDCPAIDGLIEEANDVAGEVEKKSVLDAALIAAAQAVEHYEMTRYGTLISWAKELGRDHCVALLQQTLDEVKATDRKLTAMAESQVNRKAA